MPQTLRTDVRGGTMNAFGRRAVRTTVALFLAALTSFFLPAAITPASAAPAPAGFVGLSDWAWPTDDDARQYGADGLGFVRAGLAWDWVEHTQGQRQWGGVDHLMKNAASNGYELLLVLNGCTAWSCGATRVAPQTPTQKAQFTDFVADAARRYGAGGSFWASNPQLRPVPVSWQVWNEVNVGADWPNPTTGGYADMLEYVSRTIKGVDPAARIVASGLAELPAVPEGATLDSFLSGLEQHPAFRSSADVVAVHGYAADPAGTARILDTARRIMLAAGDTRPLWVTEFGWGSGGPAHAFAVSPDEQANRLRGAFDLMVGCAARWNLEKAIWFGKQDVSPAALGEGDYWGMHTGLYNLDGSAKPALAAFREYLGRGDIGDRGTRCPLAGGADAAATKTAAGDPRVSIVQSPQFVGVANEAQVDFVTDMGNSGRAECQLDGGNWIPCTTPYRIPKNVQEGSHTLRVRAINDTGGTSTAPATASWTLDLTAPTTVFTKKPAKRSTTKKPVKALFGVKGTRLDTSSRERISFQCKLNRDTWKPCTSSYRTKLKKSGRHTLAVRAIDAAGNVDPRGASAKFTLKKR